MVGSNGVLSLLLLVFVSLGANLGGIKFPAWTQAITVPFVNVCGFSDKLRNVTDALFDPGPHVTVTRDCKQIFILPRLGNNVDTLRVFVDIGQT